jgi:hypothetical protein
LSLQTNARLPAKENIMATHSDHTAWEVLPELAGAGQYEAECECEYEQEADGESEAFFRRLAALGRRAAGTPALRRLGISAARSALGGLGALGGGAGGDLIRGLGGPLAGLLTESESEFEDEFESEDELSPIRRAYPAALMEHLGHAAAEAESEAEAEAFIGALIPLAAQLLPRVAPIIMRAAPGLIRGAAGVVRTLHRNPTTRPMIRAVPTVVRRTVADVARQSGQGRPVPPRAAVKALARQTAGVLGNPNASVQAWRRSRALDSRYHRIEGSAGPAPRAATCSCGRAPAE